MDAYRADHGRRRRLSTTATGPSGIEAFHRCRAAVRAGVWPQCYKWRMRRSRYAKPARRAELVALVLWSASATSSACAGRTERSDPEQAHTDLPAHLAEGGVASDGLAALSCT